MVFVAVCAVFGVRHFLQVPDKLLEPVARAMSATGSGGTPSGLSASTPPIPKTISAPKEVVAGQALLPPINTPVKEILGELKILAAAGNANAACRLAFEVQRCSPDYLDSGRRFAAILYEQAEKLFIMPARRQKLIEDAEAAIANQHKMIAFCQGVPNEESTDAWRYLLQAAQAGHGPSMTRFASAPPSGPQFEVLDGLLAYRDHAPALLEKALELGYPEAYEQARLTYKTGSLWGLRVPIDRPRALAYAIALRSVSTPQEIERLEGVVANTKRELSSEENMRALQLADRYAEKLLQRVEPGSVDFTRGTYTKDDGSHCQ